MSNEAHGWKAIDAQVDALYEGQEPVHWGSIVKYRSGGPDPIDGTSAYVAADPPHWHYVSYGLTELYGKTSRRLDRSGWGFELTFRLAREAAETDPPLWPANLFNSLARYVFDSRNVFEAGHHFNLNSKIYLEAETDIRAVAFIEDPQLGRMETRNGSVQFLQIVGITLDELRAIVNWKTSSFLDLMRLRNPLLVTDLARASHLAEPAFRSEVDARTRSEGSSMGTYFIDQHDWDCPDGQAGPLVVTIGALYIDQFVALLRGRLPFHKPFVLHAGNHRTRFEPSSTPAWLVDDGVLVIQLPPQTARELADILKPLRGDYPCPSLPDVTLRVEPSSVKDWYGKVSRVVG